MIDAKTGQILKVIDDLVNAEDGIEIIDFIFDES